MTADRKSDFDFEANFHDLSGRVADAWVSVETPCW
jgi:hypothetical protein